MKNISKWLLMGSILVGACSCQPKQPNNSQDEKGDIESNTDKEEKESCTSAKTPGAKISTPPLRPVIENQTASMPTSDSSGVEEKATPAAKENSIRSSATTDSAQTSIQAAESSIGLEEKANIFVKAAIVAPKGIENVTENKSTPAIASK